VDYKKISTCENPNHIAGTCKILIHYLDSRRFIHQIQN